MASQTAVFRDVHCLCDSNRQFTVSEVDLFGIPQLTIFAGYTDLHHGECYGIKETHHLTTPDHTDYSQRPGLAQRSPAARWYGLSCLSSFAKC